MNPGRNSLGTLGFSTFSGLVHNQGATFKPVGITVDTSTITANATDVPYAGGETAKAGDKSAPALTVWYKLGNGKYGIAGSGTTLVRGECFLSNKHYYQSIHDDQIGEVFDRGIVKFAALQVGGTGQPTLSNFLAAFPGISLLKDAA